MNHQFLLVLYRARVRIRPARKRTFPLIAKMNLNLARGAEAAACRNNATTTTTVAAALSAAADACAHSVSTQERRH